MKTTTEVTADDVFELVLGCERHGHLPDRLDVTVSAWRQLARFQYPIPLEPGHFHMDIEVECGDHECEGYRRAMRVKPGDEPGTLVGVPVRIIADPPPPIVAVHEEAPVHV